MTIRDTIASTPCLWYRAVSRRNHQRVSARHHVNRSLIICFVPYMNSHPASVIPSTLTDCRSTAGYHANNSGQYPLRCGPSDINRSLLRRFAPDVDSQSMFMIPAPLTGCRSTARSHTNNTSQYPTRCGPINSSLQPA